MFAILKIEVETVRSDSYLVLHVDFVSRAPSVPFRPPARVGHLFKRTRETEGRALMSSCPRVSWLVRPWTVSHGILSRVVLD